MYIVTQGWHKRERHLATTKMLAEIASRPERLWLATVTKTRIP